MPSCTLRIARPTNDLPALVKFYTTALGLTVIASFENHAGYDGAMLGHPECSWHLEFTYQHGETVPRAPTKEHLLVFYIKEKDDWDKAVKRVEDAGGVKVKSENPWWDASGVTFEDPDGYRVVLQNSGWRQDPDS
ncbi:Glyoxalase/bleomycin resistance protein/dioxygenase [Hyaloscypha variabilis]|jgi:catechol 2,3-dioxygenase-like lactoylglutathione lyase family enzyme|uniref:Glyoxalase/bleomycin resistance protein/dioxygenase n=1 Tax=Hyaloscypha variabilis (strain UAMH 11265 / GT02V1 / F) TaxID=1149755 RepID=A0A2J6R6Y4_HYAVF|nr:Glyoxalase/bleomycin resistance protein/dioxygenase [Hyaloscypha variabilis F]